MMPTVYTVGHSNHSLADFLALLAQVDVQCLVDIRKLTGSRAQPQFNADALAAALATQGVGYLHLAALGGLRGRSPGMDGQRNGWWSNASFHRYADYASTQAFAQGLQQQSRRAHHNARDNHQPVFLEKPFHNVNNPFSICNCWFVIFII